MSDYKRANYLKREIELAHRNAKAADAIEELQKAVLRLEEESGILDELWYISNA